MAESNEERVQRGAPIVHELLTLIRPMLYRHDLPTVLAVLIGLNSDWVRAHPPEMREKMLKSLIECVRNHIEVTKHGSS